MTVGPGRDRPPVVGWPVHPLQCATVVTALLGNLAAGTLHPAVAAALVAVVVVAAVAGPAEGAPRLFGPPATTASQARTLGSWALVLVAIAAVALHVAGDPVAGLSVAAAALLCAQLLRLDGARAGLLVLVLAVATSLLAVSRSPGTATSLAAGLCLVLTLACLHLLHRRHERSFAAVAEGSEHSRAAATALVRLVAVVAVTAVVVVLVGPSGAPGASGGALARALGGAEGLAGPGRGQGRAPGAYTSGNLDMRTRGRLPTYPVVEVPADSPALWRGATLSAYSSGLWFGSPEQDAAPSGRPQRRDRVRGLVGYDGIRLSPGAAVAVMGPTQATSQGGGVVLRDPNGGPAQEYWVVSSAGALTDDELDSSRERDPRDRADLAVREGVPERVVALGQSLVRPDDSVGDAVRKVSRYLAQNATYDLDAPVPGRGQDPVDHFLFESHRGFCEQFAAAAVILLRSGGIPARMVTGFAATGPASGGWRTVTADQAHAWIDVWVPGRGWSEADPTPPSARGTSSLGALARLRLWLSDAGHRRWLAGGLVVAALGVAGLLSLRRRRRDGGLVGPVAGQRLPRETELALARLHEALLRTGRPRDPSETVSELTRRMALTGEQAWAMEVVERDAYGARRPPAVERLRAVMLVDALSAELLARDRDRQAADL